jgi:hypothetical protein
MAENIGLFKHLKVETDGKTVWVNTETGCIARFGEYAYELKAHGHVFTMARDSSVARLTPLCKTHWRGFVDKVKKVYKFEIPEEYMPRRFRG